MPKVSVILTSFNHVKYIRDAIDSTINQTFTDFDLIIVDDASTDDSWSIIQNYLDPRIRAYCNEVNEGGYLINKALSQGNAAEYIAIHHSDDIWEPDKLKKQVAFLDAHPEIGAVFTNALAIAENGLPLTDEKHYYFNRFNQPNRTRHEWLRFFFTQGNALCHPSVLIRKSCYDDCGLYRYGLPQTGDYDMWIRLCMKHEIHILPEKLVKFRVLDKEANASGNRQEVRIRARYEFLKLFQNYLKIDSFDDLKRIFPSVAKYDRNEETDLGFALAMVGLEEQPTSVTRLLWLDLLFEAINNPKRAGAIKRLYDFDHKKFIVLTTQHDVFSREKVSDLSGVIAQLQTAAQAQQQKLQAQKQKLDLIHASLGWKLVTQGWRVVDKLFPNHTRRRKIFDAMIRSLKT
jgi:glycosyltransferase involved in cell wall biosynthesis